MRQGKTGASGSRDICPDQGPPEASHGIESIYIVLSVKDALRLHVATGDMVEIKRTDRSIHARVEVEAARNGAAHPLILSFDPAMEKKIELFLRAPPGGLRTNQFLEILKTSNGDLSPTGMVAMLGDTF